MIDVRFPGGSPGITANVKMIERAGTHVRIAGCRFEFQLQ